MSFGDKTGGPEADTHRETDGQTHNNDFIMCPMQTFRNLPATVNPITATVTILCPLPNKVRSSNGPITLKCHRQYYFS